MLRSAMQAWRERGGDPASRRPATGEEEKPDLAEVGYGFCGRAP